MTIPTLTGIAAGYPDYPAFFGTDGAYTAYPLVVSGQWDTAIAHLRAIRDVSRIVNGATGKVIHEVEPDGSVFFGANDDKGNTNETAQFATAVELVWRWSGNNVFRDEMYDFVQDGLRYITSTLDTNSNGCPEGLGMVERTGMAAEKLDVTVYTWQALESLSRMAASKGDPETAEWATAKANALATQFDAGWWMPRIGLYADSTTDCAQPTGQHQQRHWINATPMEVGLAPPARAATALTQLETDVFSGATGLFHTGRIGGSDGKGELRAWTLPTSVMAVAEATYGRLGAGQALRYMGSIAAQLDLEMPGALPEIAPSPDYEPFSPFTERAMFMQAWSSYGIQWPVIRHFLGIQPNVPAQELAVVPHVPPTWPGLSVQNLRVGPGSLDAAAGREDSTYTTTVAAPAGWRLTIGVTLPPAAEVDTVMLDGSAAQHRVADTLRGREVLVETTTGVTRTLTVVTRN